jgi:hypothetical protein
MAVVIGQSVPQLTMAFAALGMAGLNAMQILIPKFLKVIEVLIMGIITTIHRMIPRIAASGAQMILKLLAIIKVYIPHFARAATDIMIAFIRAIADEVPRLVDEGAKAIIKFVNGIATAIDNNAEEMGRAGGRLASAIIRGMVNGIGAGIDEVASAARNIASSALDTVKSWLGIASPSKEFYKLGRWTTAGFANGLKSGNRKEVRTALNDMRKMIADTIKSTAEDMKQASEKLKKLNSASTKDYKAIAKAQRDLTRARNEHAKAIRAQNLVKTWGDEQKKLEKLAVSYTKVTDKLKKAEDNLKAATKTRDDYQKSIQDQYDNLPDFDKDTKLDDFVANLEKQVADTQIFTAQLQKLREMGLSDAAYKELLGKGTDAIPFAQQILEGGQASVDQLNTLGSALDQAAKQLGDNASTSLYQAGVDAAAGLVAGLKKEQASLDKQMDRLANRMVYTLKKKLGIKSPSKVFAEQGAWSVKGLAKGLEATSKVSEKAAEQVGLDTIDAMRKTLSSLSETALDGVDLDPVIRPVMDLTQLQSDAIKMEELLSGNEVSVGGQLAQALALAAERSAQASAAGLDGGPQVVFNQTNNSPVALSEATIYRQTKNQISTVKGALKN